MAENNIKKPITKPKKLAKLDFTIMAIKYISLALLILILALCILVLNWYELLFGHIDSKSGSKYETVTDHADSMIDYEKETLEEVLSDWFSEGTSYYDGLKTLFTGTEENRVYSSIFPETLEECPYSYVKTYYRMHPGETYIGFSWCTDSVLNEYYEKYEARFKELADISEYNYTASNNGNWFIYTPNTIDASDFDTFFTSGEYIDYAVTCLQNGASTDLIESIQKEDAEVIPNAYEFVKSKFKALNWATVNEGDWSNVVFQPGIYYYEYTYVGDSKARNSRTQLEKSYLTSDYYYSSPFDYFTGYSDRFGYSYTNLFVGTADAGTGTYNAITSDRYYTDEDGNTTSVWRYSSVPYIAWHYEAYPVYKLELTGEVTLSINTAGAEYVHVTTEEIYNEAYETYLALTDGTYPIDINNLSENDFDSIAKDFNKEYTWRKYIKLKQANLSGGDVYAIFMYLINEGFSPEGAAAICGNIQCESGGNPSAVNASGAFGICQWMNNRLNNLQSYSDYESLDVQVQFMIDELTSSYSSVYSSIYNATDVIEATCIFCAGYEICYAESGTSEDYYVYGDYCYWQNLSGRKNAAQDIYAWYSAVSDNEICAEAIKYLGGTYVWGGKTLTEKGGVDCSGFTKAIYAKFGYTLNDFSCDQAKNGRAVSYEELQPGDLIVWGNNTEGHVAIYAGNGSVIHAANETDGICIGNIDTASELPVLGYRRIVE